MEVESVDEGIVGKILVAEGTEAVPVNQVIGILLEDGEDASAANEAPATAVPAPETTDTPPAADETPAAEAEAVPAAPAAAPAASSGDVKASPLARRIADQAGVDLGAVQGSGAHGKVVRSDVEAAMTGGAPAAKSGTANISMSGALPGRCRWQR